METSEDEMINRILRFYAWQNMKDQKNFKQVLQTFGLDQQFQYDEEIELLKSRMIEYKLLRSKIKGGRLTITNLGRDIVFKHGGWIKYQQRKESSVSLLTKAKRVEVWVPIAISIIAIAIPLLRESATAKRSTELDKAVERLELQVHQRPYVPAIRPDYTDPKKDTTLQKQDRPKFP